MALCKIDVLKIDKDCVISNDLLRDWVRLIVLPTCRAYGVKVASVETCPSPRKGFHVYIPIGSPIHAETAWRLQFLLGDDCRRVSLNHARWQAGYSKWNNLFEGVRPRMTEVYAERNTAGWFAKQTVAYITHTSRSVRVPCKYNM